MAEKTEKTPVVPTSYKILRANGLAWIEVQSVTATSTTAAVRACVSKLAEKDQAGTFVAVPARSWRPVTVQPQTSIRLELTQAKP